MRKKPRLSSECLEQLHAWIHANCPYALENDEFLPGLLIALRNEATLALKNEPPSSQHFFATNPLHE